MRDARQNGRDGSLVRDRGLRFITILCLVTRLVAAPKPAAEINSSQVQHDIAVLAEQKILSSPDYWVQHVVTGGTCDGEKVAELLTTAAKVFKAVTNTAQAVEVLAQQKILGARDYWESRAVPGKAAEAWNVAIVLNRIVSHLPVPPPPSAKAKPLEPMPVANLRKSYDVVIAGAGTGGCGAAIQAARMGRSVLLIEETDWIGGQMNAAAVTSMDEGVTLCRERGLYRELCGLIQAHYQPLGINAETAYWHGHICVEPRVGRVLLHKMLGDARGNGTLDLVLGSRVTKVLKKGDTVTGVELESVTGSSPVSKTVQSQILIDATEWGDVIPLTGARYRVGNCTSDNIIPTHRVQDNTWTAVVKVYPQGPPPELRITSPPPGYTSNVHAAFVRSLVPGDTISSRTRPWTFRTFIDYRGMPDSSRPGDSTVITRTHLNYNNDYPATVAEIETMERRRQTDRAMRLKTLHLIYYIQNTLGHSEWAVANDEGYDTLYNRAEINAWLAERPNLEPYRAMLQHFSIIPYTRESRRIVGLHTLTAREIERRPGSPTLFPNAVALGDYAVDLHGARRPQDLELELDRAEDVPNEEFGGRGIGPFPIPFECFIPEKVDGFLPAEKNISQSRLANGATRLQPHTLLMGQAAGAIAALAIERHVRPRDLDPLLVQVALLGAGDVLFLKPIMDVRHDSSDWAAVQLVLTRGLLAVEKNQFNPSGQLTADDLVTIRAKLGGELPLALKDPTRRITRVEAARALAQFLTERAGHP